MFNKAPFNLTQFNKAYMFVRLVDIEGNVISQSSFSATPTKKAFGNFVLVANSTVQAFSSNTKNPNANANINGEIFPFERIAYAQ